jgi:hypothetical protein
MSKENSLKSRKQEGRRICKCDCGGVVRGVYEFDRLWTWCDTCSPVVVVKPKCWEA